MFFFRGGLKECHFFCNCGCFVLSLPVPFTRAIDSPNINQRLRFYIKVTDRKKLRETSKKVCVDYKNLTSNDKGCMHRAFNENRPHLLTILAWVKVKTLGLKGPQMCARRTIRLIAFRRILTQEQERPMGQQEHRPPAHKFFYAWAPMWHRDEYSTMYRSSILLKI